MQRLRTTFFFPIMMAGLLGIALSDRSMMPLVSIPLAREFSMTTGETDMFINAYAIAQVAVIAGASHLTSVFGLRRVLVVGLFVATAGTTLIMVAPDTTLVIAGRIISGLGVGICLPPAIASVADVGGDQVGRSIGRYLGTASLVMLIAPVAAALATEVASWRAVFALELLLLVPPIVIVARAVEPRPRRRDIPLALPACVIAGVAFATLSMGAQRAGIDGWGSPQILVLFGIGITAAIVLIIHDRRSDAPVFNRSVLASNAVRRDAGATFLLGGMVAIAMIYTTLLLGTNLGYSMLATSLFLIFILLPQVLIARRAGGFYDRLGFVTVGRVGVAILVPGTVILAVAAVTESAIVLAAGMILTGAAFGILVTITSSDPQRAVPAHLRAETSGVVSTSRNLGGAGLVAIAMTLVADIDASAPFLLLVLLALALAPLIALRHGDTGTLRPTFELPRHGLPRRLHSGQEGIR